MMVLSDLICGFILIVLGILVVPFPMLIAGYNTLPKEEREKINIYGYSRMMRFWLCVMGIVLMIGTYVLRLMDQASWIPGLVFGVIIIGVGIMTLNKKQFITGKIQTTRKSKVAMIFTIVVVIGTIGFVINSAYPAEITVNEKELVIRGAYGVTIPLESITKVECRDQLPASILRSNGTSIGKYHKGHFMMEEIGSSLLYLHTGKGPYLIVYSDKEVPLIINRDTPEEIQSLYNKLQKEVSSGL